MPFLSHAPQEHDSAAALPDSGSPDFLPCFHGFASGVLSPILARAGIWTGLASPNRSLKELINATLRRGIASEQLLPVAHQLVTRPHAFGFKPDEYRHHFMEIASRGANCLGTPERKRHLW